MLCNKMCCRFGRYCNAWAIAMFRAAVRCIQEVAGHSDGVAPHVLPLLAAWILPRPADGDRQLGGVQGGAAGASVPRTFHAVAATHDGLLKGKTIHS